MKEVIREWGNFKQFILNKKCTVKILELKPKQRLSLQVHKKRDEMWYFLDSASVQIGKAKHKVKSGDLVKVKKNSSHRIISGNNNVRVLEISTGFFNEHDEIRLEDDYGRE